MMSDLFVIGADPGGRQTGIVARKGRELLGFEVIERVGKSDLPDLEYITAVVDAIWQLGRQPQARGGVLAVEGVTKPSGHAKGRKGHLIDPAGLMGTSMVFGAILAEFRHTPLIVVEPGQHGQAALRFYPPELVGPRERTGSGGRLRHCRSAWDIARAGATRARSVITRTA